jgi:hypothetical protein
MSRNGEEGAHEEGSGRGHLLADATARRHWLSRSRRNRDLETRNIGYMDKLVDELAMGRPMETILRG